MACSSASPISPSSPARAASSCSSATVPGRATEAGCSASQRTPSMPIRSLLLAWTLLALVATPAPLYAQAPDAPRLAAAKELMQVAGVAQQFDEVMPVLAQ